MTEHKAKASLKDIRTAIKNYLSTMKMMPGGKEILGRISSGLQMNREDFESRWTAD